MKQDWRRWLPWLLVGAYVVSPIDLDPGLPFTDAAAIALGYWHHRRFTPSTKHRRPHP